jgi:thioesterase domain-containing protein/aryl carrier-like protein
MVPAIVHTIAGFPTTPNGKTDFEALRAIAKQSGRSGKRFVPARSRLEWQLAELVAPLLEGKEIGVADDLFKAGLDSLHVMQLLAEVERSTGARVSMGQFVDRPSVEGLASVIGSRLQPEHWSPLVPLREQGTDTPFFCVHPIGGNVMCYRTLAQHMTAGRPVYGLQAPGVDGICPPETSVGALAERYLLAIREVQPHGPYMVGGWSFGAIVAYDMACRLRAEGEEVAALVAIDASIQYAFGVVLRVFPNDGVGLLGFLGKPLDEQIAIFRQRVDTSGLLPPGATDAMARRIFRNCDIHVRSSLDYDPPDYPGRLTLLAAEEPFIRTRRTPLQEWQGLCREVDRIEVPGNHLTMMKPPHVKELAKHLCECLDGSDDLARNKSGKPSPHSVPKEIR